MHGDGGSQYEVGCRGLQVGSVNQDDGPWCCGHEPSGHVGVEVEALVGQRGIGEQAIGAFHTVFGRGYALESPSQVGDGYAAAGDRGQQRHAQGASAGFGHPGAGLRPQLRYHVVNTHDGLSS